MIKLGCVTVVMFHIQRSEPHMCIRGIQHIRNAEPHMCIRGIQHIRNAEPHMCIIVGFSALEMQLSLYHLYVL